MKPELVKSVATCTVLLSAFLLFFVQPLSTRLATPLIGGAPGVWITASLFFQVALIAGYLYAHLLIKLGSIRKEIALHLGFWGVGLFMLPIVTPEDWRLETSTGIPGQTLALYAQMIGMPFFFLASNSSLIQSWYARSGSLSSRNPYVLYGASNLGSLGALFAFPVFAEPFIGIAKISTLWFAGFALLGILIITLLLSVNEANNQKTNTAKIGASNPDIGQYATWMTLGFVPSSLMLVVSTKLSTDFGSIPLTWVLPLALFLLTFVVAFGVSESKMTSVSPFYVLGFGLLGAVLLPDALLVLSIGPVLMLLTGFFTLALAFHRVLFLSRPDPAYLTGFYLAMSVGGALGGLLNAIIAPTFFTSPIELHITLAIAIGLLLAQDKSPRRVALFVAITLCLIMMPLPSVSSRGLTALIMFLCIMISPFFGVHALRPKAGILLMGLLVLSAHHSGMPGATLLHQERNFFGIHRVIDYPNGFRAYVNGNTMHGGQYVEFTGRPTPQTYYHPTGGMGLFAGGDHWARSKNIAVIGLGAGAMTEYLRPGQMMDYFEIDPAVIEIASNPEYFQYLQGFSDQVEHHLGDARVTLAAQDKRYDVILIDAYSSDAIPMHISTLEAIRMYREKLSDGGVLLFHTTNRHFDLRPALKAAGDALGMNTYSSRTVSDEGFNVDLVQLKSPATPEPGAEWVPVEISLTTPWTDDKASPLSVLKLLWRDE